MMIWLGWGLFALVLLVTSGLLLADRLTPRATGTPSTALPPEPAQTPIDRELAPYLAAHPGETAATLLPDGLDAFAARAASARLAGRSLDLQYYMWHDDLVGHLLAREVYAAAERGVRVRLLLDDINTKGLDPALLALDAHPNIEVRLYNPFRNRRGVWRLLEMVQRFFSVNHRMHNKAWIADGRIALVGGRNIGDEYFDANRSVNFRDLDMLLLGPAVADASAIFDDFWNSSAAVPIEALNPQTPENLHRLVAALAHECADAAAQVYLDRVAASPSAQRLANHELSPHWSASITVASDPPLKTKAADRSGWLQLRLAAHLGGVHSEVLLISPYFVPGKQGTATLLGLARGGTRVGVVTNSLAANDVPAVHSGYERYRRQLLDGGVGLFEIRRRGPVATHGLFGSGASLHTKAFVIDGARGFVGSFNLDPRSANLNTEMGVLFDDASLARDLRQEYLRLAMPELSYQLRRGADGSPQWLDRSVQPPLVLEHEPEAGWWLRTITRLISWLPIESQL
ncbi:MULTISPECIES: phospholipase D family protein [Rhodanobacter]|uniref:phospholipase D family protein n=1 Tax=Rhodanobacter TaxID=75309 RepID=UPI0004232665|nr:MULTISPECIES: phospholipase D family protein [Rhodanobacter]KZC19513.1 cardiolipin synthase [Rhodanobacter denitrificans]UJJ49846.1 phospholipase D family protein [Rhodanobacter denitrificans]UJM92559.1 phospholipase D family protein [Rhodanobacter denitrificans]UJM96089.1 phospholipase D family protein [Rhodanobacter denitrificans]UJN21080.1 phospholipase D family protein [Rhodanobacter denitrificans]